MSTEELDLVELYIGPKDPFLETVSRAQLELTCQHRFERLVAALQCLDKAAQGKGMMISDIDHVVLVGGGAFIPKVQDLVQAFYGKQPVVQYPLESVACGAALYGELLRTESHESMLQDVLPYSVGTDCVNAGFNPDDPPHLMLTSNDFIRSFERVISCRLSEVLASTTPITIKLRSILTCMLGTMALRRISL